MAVKLADAFVLLDGDTKPFDNALKETRASADGWAKNLGVSVKGLATGVILSGAAAAAAGVAAIGVAAFNVSNDTKQAANDIAASLGIPTEEAEKFAKVAQDVYGNNFADNIGDATSAVVLLAQQMEGLSDSQLQNAAEDAFALRDVFDLEVGESISAAKTLMDNFGVSSEEAFDLIAAGQQKGLNRSGDFLDTIEEYSTQFKEGGASAEEFFNFLESGMAGGALGTDKAADAFKEFRLRISDGTDATKEAVEQLFLSEEAANEFFNSIRSGETDTVLAFQQIRDALVDVEDPAARMGIATALLGTQFEDLGDTAVSNLAFVGSSFDDVSGATEALNQKYESFGAFFSGLWRRMGVAVSRLTDILLDLANGALPRIDSAFSVFETSIVPTIEKVLGLFGGGELSSSIKNNLGFLDTFRSWFDENLPLIQSIVEKVLGGIASFWESNGETIMATVGTIWDNIKMVIDTVLNTVLDLVTLALQVLNGDWEAAGETLAGIIERIWATIYDIFSDSVALIWSLITETNWLDLGKTIINGILGGIKGLAALLTTTVSRIATDMKDAFLNVNWTGIGSGIIENIKSGLDFSGFTGWMKGKLSGITDLFPGSPVKDKSSPLTKLQRAGEGIIANVQEGIDRKSISIDTPSANLFDSFSNLISSSGNTSGPIQFEIHQNFAGNVDAEMVRDATSSGILQAARSLGLAGA